MKFWILIIEILNWTLLGVKGKEAFLSRFLCFPHPGKMYANLV